MVKLSLPLLLGLATSSINAASLPKPSSGPWILMDLTSLYDSVTNTTSLGAGFPGIDPRFNIFHTPRGAPLRPISCLLNAVNAMSNLALRDFDGSVGAIVARLPSYPDVVIRSEGTMRVRYVLWGIWSFALIAMSEGMCQTRRLRMEFDGVTVGYFRTEKPDSRILRLAGDEDDNDAVSLSSRSDVALAAMGSSKTMDGFPVISNSTSLSLTNVTNPANAGDLRVSINPIGHTLTNREFFTPIVGGLGYVARFPSTSQVNGFKLRLGDEDTWIEFRDFSGRPRTEAPFFQYQWVAKALGSLPAQMAPLGRWSEAIVVMQVDGISVGDGWIRKGEFQDAEPVL